MKTEAKDLRADSIVKTEARDLRADSTVKTEARDLRADSTVITAVKDLRADSIVIIAAKDPKVALIKTEIRADSTKTVMKEAAEEKTTALQRSPRAAVCLETMLPW